VLEPNNMFMMGEDGSGRHPTMSSLMVTNSSFAKLKACLTEFDRKSCDAASTSCSSTSANTNTNANSNNNHQMRLGRGLPVKLTRKPVPITAAASATSDAQASEQSRTLPSVVGDVDRFQMTAQGRFTLEIEKKGNAFLLRLF
jgi:hypothetical protein